MVLTIDERENFFKNWLKLLTFVNNKYDIIKNFGNPKSPIGLNEEYIKIKKNLGIITVLTSANDSRG